jgi:hypothetical protein
MSNKYNRNQGDKVWFDITGAGNVAGWGVIKGVASGPFPPLGYQWIVEVLPPAPMDATVYPFSHIVVFDNQIKEPPVVKTP